MNDRDRLAHRIHANGEAHEGICWGPTPADYAAADKQLNETKTVTINGEDNTHE